MRGDAAKEYCNFNFPNLPTWMTSVEDIQKEEISLEGEEKEMNELPHQLFVQEPRLTRPLRF